MQRRQGAAQIDADASHFARAHRAALRHRSASVSPSMNSIQMPTCSVDLFGAVDGNDVGVTDAGEMLRLGPAEIDRATPRGA